MFTRRSVLKGLGVSLSLPWLESVHGSSKASKVPVKTAFVFMPNGFIMPSWDVNGDGPSYELSETMKPLAALKSDFTVYSNLCHDKAKHNGDGAGDHARCSGTFLTAVQVKKTDGKEIRAGISIDQVAAQQIGKNTELPSIELGCEKGQLAGGCDSGYSCAYSSNISWASEKMPMVKEVNPSLVFTRLFGDPAQHMSAQEKARRAQEEASILDLVAEDSRYMLGKVSSHDKQKIEEYLDSVRSIERRLQKISQESVAIQVPDMPKGVPHDFKVHLRLMYDMMVIAFQANKTHVATMMLGNAGSNRTYDFLGHDEGHHSLSHHGNDQKKVDMIKQIDLFQVEQFAYFLRRLKETPDGNSNLLENSMILLGSGIADGNRHSHTELPVILAGNAGGALKTGVHKKASKDTPIANLYLSMMDVLNVKIDKFGDSTGRYI
jgi:hypothetical protein